MNNVLHSILSKKNDVEHWLRTLEGGKEFPIYSSVDIRDSGFKTAVIDTNLFPAGFNNLSEEGLKEAEKHFKEAILRKYKDCRNIVIVMEEHTRNVWYLENVRVLEQILTKAGFHVRIGTFLTFQPPFCDTVKFIELETATGQNLRVFCFKCILKEHEEGKEKCDLILLNNDLIGGIPNLLKKCKIPICPPAEAGWHMRSKLKHFRFTDQLLHELSEIVQVDRWLLSSFYEIVDKVDIREENDRIRLSKAAKNVLEKIQKKYDEYGIKEKPYIVIKADAGTYGMGVLIVEDNSNILSLTHKDRNKLFKGKGGTEIHRYLIQEGIPSIHEVDGKASEVCLYQVEQNYIGSFYRTNAVKGPRENLNSTGMEFNQISSESDLFYVYRILARIAAIAAHREILELKGSQQ